MSTLRNGTPPLPEPENTPEEYIRDVLPDPEPPLAYTSPVEAVAGVGGVVGVQPTE